MDEKKGQEERKKMKGWTWKQGSNEGKDGDEEIHEDVRKEGGEKATFKGKTEERKNESIRIEGELGAEAKRDRKKIGVREEERQKGKERSGEEIEKGRVEDENNGREELKKPKM